MLHRLHRASAFVIGVYALAHLANHLAAVDSVASHIAFMDRLRLVTRLPAVEALLLACVLFQAVSGLVLAARRRGQRRAPFDRLQARATSFLQ